MITFDPTITFGAGAIIGALAMKIIDHRLAKDRTGDDRRIKEFNTAADAFRDAFVSELSAIRNPSFNVTTKPIDPHDLLKEAFGKHRTAYEVFRLSLDSRRLRNEFDREWVNYYAYDNEGNGGYEYLLKYSPGWGERTARECVDLAVTNIERLLDFAQHK